MDEKLDNPLNKLLEFLGGRTEASALYHLGMNRSIIVTTTMVLVNHARRNHFHFVRT